MVAFGRLFEFTYLLCWNHALHLAVSDIIYKKKNVSSGFQFISLSSELAEPTDPSNSEKELSDMDSDCDESDSDIETAPDNEDNDVDENRYGNVIRKMRMIIKLFRLSPVRNSILQKNIKRKLNKELSLIIDTPTRWNSLFESASRFLRVVECIIQSLSHKDINKAGIWSQQDTVILQVLIKSYFCKNKFYFFLFYVKGNRRCFRTSQICYRTAVSESK